MINDDVDDADDDNQWYGFAQSDSCVKQTSETDGRQKPVLAADLWWGFAPRIKDKNTWRPSQSQWAAEDGREWMDTCFYPRRHYPLSSHNFLSPLTMRWYHTWPVISFTFCPSPEYFPKSDAISSQWSLNFPLSLSGQNMSLSFHKSPSLIFLITFISPFSCFPYLTLLTMNKQGVSERVSGAD